MLKNWIRIFLYQIRNNRFFTALNILGLSIGIAGLIFSILYWNDEHAYNAWNPEKDNTFQVISDLGEGMMWAATTEPMGRLLKNEPEVETYCYTQDSYDGNIIIYKGRKEIIEKIYSAQSTFFSFFPFHFIKGNAKSALDKELYCAISEKTAQRLFGNENPMGKSLIYGEKTIVVNGVYNIPGKSSVAPEIVVNNISPYLEENRDSWNNFNFNLFLKLKNPDDAPAVERKMYKLFYTYRMLPDAKQQGMTIDDYIKKNGKSLSYLEPLATARLHSRSNSYPEGQGNFQFLMIMVGLSVLILILSIANYVNLATANALKRAKEVGIRKIIGASRANIVYQFVFETVLTTLFAILLSLVIVEIALPYYNAFLQKELVIHSSQFYLELVIIFAVVVAIAGIFPAIYVSRFETLKVLKGNFGRSKSGIWLRNGMLVFQFAIASFFMIGSYIVYEQINYLANKDLGFKGNQILKIAYRNPYNFREEGIKVRLLERYTTIRRELLKIDGIDQVGTGSFSLGSNSSFSSSSFEYHGQTIQSQNMGVDFSMLNMLGVTIVKGRNLSEKFATDSINSVLVNETAAKMMHEKNVVGKVIPWNDKQLTIVGIVKDFHNAGPQDAIPPMVFFNYKTVDWMIFNTHHIYVKVNPKHIEKTILAIEKFWGKNVDADYPFEYDFLDKSYARTYEAYTNQKNLFSLLNVVVIMIALFGLFALASYSIERRMKEIAIRKTLGAETQVLLKSLSKQYIIFCIIGFAAAIFPVYFLLDKWLQNFAYRIDITFLPFGIGFFALMLLTLIVVLSRAYQATQVEVLKYLKYE
ncbi:MAG: ABC transporter permease [Flavobacterium sp.]|nr:ABC transporter permease [Flavobacterium sp.]